MKTTTLLVVGLLMLQPSASDVVATLDSYLASYEPKLSSLIADEAMEQEVWLAGGDLRRRDTSGMPVARRQRRRLSSEVAFIALPDQAGWLGFRHVKNIDNRPSRDAGAALAPALATPGYDTARRLLAASAEHNLGLPRTINLPNLPLEFLHPRNRRRLVPRLDGHERVRRVDTTRVLFTERMTPTVIQNPNGTDMPSVIRVWIDPATGALWRAEVTTFESAETRVLKAQIRVEFDRHKALDMLVPIEMREVFPAEPPDSGTGVAHYTNFRRFQTSARIVPQP
jgi:hypothetical protein